MIPIRVVSAFPCEQGFSVLLFAIYVLRRKEDRLAEGYIPRGSYQHTVFRLVPIGYEIENVYFVLCLCGF